MVQFVRTKDVLLMLGVSRTTLWRMVQAGLFPQPIVISRRATGHLLQEVEQWMKSRSDRASGPDPGAISRAARRRRGRG